MYDDGFGNIFHPTTLSISCRDIPKDLEYDNRKSVHHNHQGRRTALRNGKVVFLKGSIVQGTSIKVPRLGSPIAKKIKTSSAPKFSDVVHDESLPSFPGWNEQANNLQKKVGSNDMSSILSEIENAWKVWTREAAKAYLRKEEIVVPYKGRVPWKDSIVRSSGKIADQLRLNTKIISMFFEKFRDRALLDCSFLVSENGRTVGELEKQLEDFVKATKRILTFEWPMDVAHLMLDEGESWIPLLVTSTAHTVFNAVAATMARLLYDLLQENINRVRTVFEQEDEARLIIVLNEGDESFDYWKRVNVLLELSRVPRVDHKIYPKMFKEAFIDIRNWFSSLSIVFSPLPQPFRKLNDEIEVLNAKLKEYEDDPKQYKAWENIATRLLAIRDEILRKPGKILQDFIIYDCGQIKKSELRRVTDLEEKLKSSILLYLSSRNNEIRAKFSNCSAKLFRNDVITQLRNIEEVQNELPKIKAQIMEIHEAYDIYMNIFVMPDYDIRQYYEISRLGHKLEQLVNFVWDRIHHERQWITKQVSESTSKNYYECEMIEKEWLDCLKKYRTASRINEVQKVQIKMVHLSEKSALLQERDDKLIGQRSLLGLPASPIDCVRIAKMCQFFSKLATLHYNTLLHHEACLRMRIADVDHTVLVDETEKLRLAMDEIEQEAATINEHSNTSKEALNKIQAILNEFEKLLPVLGAISCQAMKDRHWQQILQDTESSVKVEGNPLVSELLEMKFIEKAEKFEQVGMQAEKERVLEKSIETMKQQWKGATFSTHTNAGELLTGELAIQMQAHLARCQTILSSPHAFSILDQIKHWLDTLMNVNTFVNLYKQCDTRWKMIEGVFSTEDIAYQMPHEFRTFKKISLRWLHANNQITEERPILEQIDLIKKLNIELAELEILFGKMENGFHAYLRKKRAVFPRLFALSDELVLSLICDSREPINCNAYIPLLFPSILGFEQNTKKEIILVKTKSETIMLTKPVNVNLSKRHVEKWMHELDVQLKHTIKSKIRSLIDRLNYAFSPIETILSEPIQVGVMYTKIAVTFQIENAFKLNNLMALGSTLKNALRECQHAVIHKHSRRNFLLHTYQVLRNASTLVSSFITDQVVFLDDYRWTSHVRYYWHMENVFIRVGTVSIRYDYEINHFDDLPDPHFIETALKNFIFMNHFGFGGRMGVESIDMARQVAIAMGRPLVICDAADEAECRMLLDGSMLFGAIVYIKEKSAFKLGQLLEKDVYTSHCLGNLKYTFETEITINTSTMIFLSDTFNTARQIGHPQKRHRWAHVDLLRKLLQITDIPQVILQNEAIPYLARKIQQLIKLLETHLLVIVCGARLTGKTRIIAKAAEIQCADVHFHRGIWQELEDYTEHAKLYGKKNKWIVIDGMLDEKSRKALLRKEYSALARTMLIDDLKMINILALPQRVEHVEPEFSNFPIVQLDGIVDFSTESDVTDNERLLIEEVLQKANIEEFFQDVIRIIGKIKKSMTLSNQELFINCLYTSIISLTDSQKLIGSIFKEDEDLQNFFTKVPHSQGWYNYNNENEAHIPASEFYIIHVANLILGTELIPLIHSMPCLEFSNFIAQIQQNLDNLGWYAITTSIDSETTIEELKQFVDNCTIMFGSHEVTEVDEAREGSNFLLIRGIESAKIEVIDWLRNNFEKNKIMKMIWLSKYDKTHYPMRIQKFLFSINWMELTQIRPKEYPLATYEKVINLITEKVKNEEVRNAIINQLIEGLSDAVILKNYEKVCELKISEESRLVRSQAFIEINELQDIYQKEDTAKQTKERKLKREPFEIRKADARNISLLESVLAKNSVLIVGSSKPRIVHSVQLACDLNKQQCSTDFGVSNVDEWRKLMNKTLQECLIDGKESVICISVSSKPSALMSAILADCISICCHSIVPPRYLSRLMITEFGEKHTLEGKGIWQTMAAKLALLKVVVILKPEHFSWFHDNQKQLLGRLIVNWHGQYSKNEIVEEIREEMKASGLFNGNQMSTIIEVIEKLEQMSILTDNAHKLRIVSTIVKLSRKKRRIVEKTMQKYEKGMEKMKRAEEQVAGMQGELLRLQPQLLRTSIETSFLMSTIEKETIEVENAREVVAANENKANEAATKVQALKAESEAELASAIPALEAAVEALETMTQSDVSSLKTMRFPPYAVRLCMEAVCILLGVKPAKVTNENGEVVNDYWVSGQKLLSDIHFLARIRTFARDSTSRRTMKLIREKYLSKEEFDPEKVKQCSLAAEGLCRWVLAVDMYNQISKIVEPKRERLRKAETLVKQHLKQLEVKRKALLKVTDKLQGLSDQFSQMCQRKQELESQISSCETRMERAERLVQALSGEKDKWQAKMTDIAHEDSLCVPHAVGSALALHVFGKLPIDQREIELRKTMRILFPNLEVTIPCDLKSIVGLVEEPMCFVNDDDRAFNELRSRYNKIIKADDFSNVDKSLLVEAKCVVLLDYDSNRNDHFECLENGMFYVKTLNDSTIFEVSGNEYEVNRDFRIFIRTHDNDAQLENTIIINNAYTDSELRHEICERLGNANWPQTLHDYNEMVKLKRIDADTLEKTEDEMLDLLGRSKDLDDEKAIDLLAEARNLQASITAKGNQIDEMERSLRIIENRMAPCIEWSAKIVKMCYSLSKFQEFYRMPLSFLLDVLNVKLVKSLDSVDFKLVNRQISNIFWKRISDYLAWDDKHIVHHLLFSNMNYQVDRIVLEPQEKNSIDSFSNFASFVQKSGFRKLVLLKYDSEVYTSIIQFGQVSRNINWKVVSILDHILPKLEKISDENTWLLMNLYQIDYETIDKIKKILAKLAEIPNVHPAFRIIAAISEEIPYKNSINELSNNRFYFSAPDSLAQIFRRLFANFSLRTSYDKADERLRHQVIRIICLHYGFLKRSRLDPHFHARIDDADLLAAMKLFQQVRNLNELPNEKQDYNTLRKNVIEPIYFSKSYNKVYRNIAYAMTQWILEGNISVPADTSLKKILKDDACNFDDFAHFAQSHDDIILCGLNSRISRGLQAAHEKLVLMKMRSLFDKDFENYRKQNLAKKHPKVESKSPSVEGIDGREIEDLEKIISTFKIEFALEHKINTSEIEVIGEVKESKTPQATAGKSVNLKNCSLFYAQLSHGEIIETQTINPQLISVVLKCRKMIGTGNQKCLPIICPKTKDRVAHLIIQSQLPEIHWHLRGAFLTVGKI
ncbi:unnamed protein product [Caenorhabditis bovis]|uniref:Uncharacterized protein n=1 Tax=Caenorhabditis bovis TaxID=2654633 RepID=A0A8S1E8V8_9PELO|nr:unnamed protein product [Caenorhabditis bovis]